MEDVGIVWKAIDSLKDKVAEQDKEIAVLKDNMSQMMSSQMRIEALLLSLKDEFNEAKGGLKFGKYLFGVLIAITGTFVAMGQWLGGN